jgi:3-oxoacyl-[acyl-carrier protein] reductase
MHNEARFGYIGTLMANTIPVALVTGASRGIGRGIAVELARRGWSIAINFARDHEAAQDCQRLCKEVASGRPDASFEIFQADISRADDRARLVDSVVARFAWIDLLVNNAGVSPAARADLLEASEESFDRVIATNLKGPYFLTQRVARFWLSRAQEFQSAPLKPKIVIISSVSADAASINRGEYCVSKAGLSMMTKLFALRLAELGILVYEIRPGIVATEMTQPVKEKYDRMIAEGIAPIKRWGTPEDVGRGVAAIAEGRLPYSTGEVINVDGGFHIRRL